jgi:hypothetical protein
MEDEFQSLSTGSGAIGCDAGSAMGFFIDDFGNKFAIFCR